MLKKKNSKRLPFRQAIRLSRKLRYEKAFKQYQKVEIRKKLDFAFPSKYLKIIFELSTYFVTFLATFPNNCPLGQRFPTFLLSSTPKLKKWCTPRSVDEEKSYFSI